MKSKMLIASLLVILLLSGCMEKATTGEPEAGYPVSETTQAPALGYPVEDETEAPTVGYPVASENEAPDLTATAEQVIAALAQKDMEKLAEFVHPDMGVRFSPYAFVREEHQVFMPEELPPLVGSEEVYTWGAYDGTGDPIELTFDGYYEEFVYSADFANPEQMAVDERLGQGNSINNIGEFYPGASFVEYHFSGFEEEYEGMDWESLRLVFVAEDSAWWLVGVVHDEWTI